MNGWRGDWFFILHQRRVVDGAVAHVPIVVVVVSGNVVCMVDILRRGCHGGPGRHGRPGVEVFLLFMLLMKSYIGTKHRMTVIKGTPITKLRIAEHFWC